MEKMLCAMDFFSLLVLMIVHNWRVSIEWELNSIPIIPIRQKSRNYNRCCNRVILIWLIFDAHRISIITVDNFIAPLNCKWHKDLSFCNFHAKFSSHILYAIIAKLVFRWILMSIRNYSFLIDSVLTVTHSQFSYDNKCGLNAFIYRSQHCCSTHTHTQTFLMG